MKREAISKRLRFEIFARDGFTCKYCGRQSDVVPLHVDHIKPVCQDGTNDPENLITACADCNLGKAGKTIPQHVPTEVDRLRLAQERNEQIKSLRAARSAISAREKFRQELVDYWCQSRGEESAHKQTVTMLVQMVEEFGLQVVLGWIDTSSAKCFSPVKAIKYICGIRRNVREKQGVANA